MLCFALTDTAEVQKHQAAVDTAVSKLPEPNRKLLNRLITHLAKYNHRLPAQLIISST